MIGERVRLAREACRLTQEELAALAGISQGTLSDVEHARVVEPASETVARIARATQYPLSFFHLGPLPDLPEGRFRKLARGTAKVAKQVRAQVRQVVEVVQLGERVLRLPPVRLEPVSEVPSLAAIESIAAQVRRALGLGDRDPIPNLMRAVERAGGVVVRLPGQMEDHDGFSAWPEFGSEGARPVVALTGGHPGDRDRFNLAHEIGHLVLHTLRQNVVPDQAETEANRFAGALLIPKAAAVEAMRPPITLRILMGVKATWGISMAALARRAFDLNLIGQSQFVSLMKQLSARRWRRVEPVEVTPERPALIGKILHALAGEGSTSEQAARVHMPVFAYRTLAAA